MEGKRKHRDEVSIGCVIVLLLFLPVMAIVVMLSEEVFPSFYGTDNLGNGLYYVHNDPHWQAIVHSYKTRGYVFDGVHIIPKEPPLQTEGLVERVQVISVKKDDQYVIAKGKKLWEDTLYYYLIDKSFYVDKNKYFIYADKCQKDYDYRDSVIQQYVASFDDSLAFIRALEEKGIDLRFTDE